MKSLVSDRFSLSAEQEVPQLSRKQLEYRNRVRRELSTAFKLVPNQCPCLNGSGNSDVIISEKDRYELPLQSVLCLQCGTIRIDPYLDPQSLSDFYKEYYQQMYGRDVEMNDYFARQKQYGKKFYDIVKRTLSPGSNILEFGCGAGGALAIFKDHGHHVYGTEYSQKMIDYGKNAGLSNIYFGSLEEFKKNAKDLKFDLIYSNHVFEHVNEPYACLRNCIELLNPHGSLICAIPDIYNIHSHEYSFPDSDLKPMLHIAHIYNYSYPCLQHMATTLRVGIERLFPDRNIITPTSVMPEIWFRIFNTGEQDVNKTTERQQTTKQTFDYLAYFRDTEGSYLKKPKGIQVKNPIIRKLKNKVKQLINWKK